MREAERKAKAKPGGPKVIAKPKQDDIDRLLDKEISVALNGIQGTLTTLYKKK